LSGVLSGTGTPVNLSTANCAIDNKTDDDTESSIACATTDATTTAAFIATGYTNGIDLIANPQIANVSSNLSTKYECRVVYVVGSKTYKAAKEIFSITT
jgi:hypothetical protein